MTLQILTLAALLAQAPAATPTAATATRLMYEPLGDTTEPKMSLFVLTLSPGASGTSHSHPGAVFAYILEGEIENQVEPDPPKIYKAGGYFHERPMQVHRIFRNLSATEPAKILIFYNTGTLPASLKPLLQESLPNLANQEVTITKLVAPPEAALSSRAHQHAGPVFAYILKGEVENQVDPDPLKLYRAGDVFYEPPMHAHRLLRNPSKTESAELIIFQVGEKGRPLATPVEARLPYSTIDKPEFVAASEATFLVDDDIMIGVARGNVAKAYAVSDLSMHGGVHDEMPDAPINVTFCITCNTGAVFRTEVKGQRLHFDFDSMVGANEVHKDRETGSRWQQSTGEAISGPLKGNYLELYPFVRTTWKEWRRRFPNTRVLKPLPGYAENMPIRRTRINEGIPGGTSAPQGAFGKDDRLRPKEIVAGLQIGEESVAYPFSELRAARVVNDRVGGVPVLVVHQPSSDTTTAFDARVKDKALSFRARNEDASSLEDLETHSTWDAYGLSVAGPLRGTQLKTVILMPEFWFAWSEFHPKTKVFTAAASFKVLLQESAVRLNTLTLPPGWSGAGVHKHPGQVVAYILKGEVESQVDPGKPEVYRAGDIFYEPPMHAHRLFRNLSKTEPAELLIFQVNEKGDFTARPVN